MAPSMAPCHSASPPVGRPHRRHRPFLFPHCFPLFLLSFLLSPLVHASPTLQAQQATRIVGGSPADPQLARHLANLVIAHRNSGPQSDSLCTATVLSKRYLLTAAHCLLHPVTGQLSPDRARSFAYVGAPWSGPLAVGPRQTGRRLFRVAELRVLRKFNAANPYDFRHDLAVVRVDRDIAPDVGAPLPQARWPADLPRDMACALAGYGTVRHGGPRPGKLLRARMLVRPFAECLKSEHPYYHRFMGKQPMLCAVPPGWPSRAQSGMCAGDSGGPLVAYDAKSKTLRQYGVASFTTAGCATAGTAGWYVRVGSYAPQIRALLNGRTWWWPLV